MQKQIADLKHKPNSKTNYHHNKNNRQQQKTNFRNFEPAIKEETVQQTPFSGISLNNISKNHFRANSSENPQDELLLCDVQCKGLVYMMIHDTWNNGKVMANKLCNIRAGIPSSYEKFRREILSTADTLPDILNILNIPTNLGTYTEFHEYSPACIKKSCLLVGRPL